ncbi:MAG: hypothetical protein E6G22_10795 [Actinobacteria bacterium]|nr:MAG: hypothetical protein E6G22_10795 [Actinomycetota bacterium]
MEVQGFGIRAVLPAGWYGRIYTNTDGEDATRSGTVQLATVPIPDSDDDAGTATRQLMGPTDVLIMLFESPYRPWFDAQFAPVGAPLTIRPADAQAGWEGVDSSQSVFVRRVKVNDRYFQLRVVFGSQPSVPQFAKLNGLLARVTIGAPVAA